MKFFHLADLHIGKVVNGFSMIDDQSFIFEQILQLVREEKPNAVLLAGDIYDKAVPTTEAVQLFDRFLTALVKENVAVLAISGNHDSPERLQFGSQIMSDQHVHFYGTFDGQVHAVTYDDITFYLMPYIKPAFVRRFFENETIETYADAVQAVLSHTPIDETKQNVLLAHQSFISSGVELERCDSEISAIGGLDTVSAQLAATFDYAAFGHFHSPQKVGSDTMRYAGSPLKYSASECFHKKSVAIVEMKGKGNVSVLLKPLTPRRDMRKIKGTMAILLSDAVVSAGNADDYMHITLTDEEEIIDAIGKLRTAYPNIMSLSFENSRTRATNELSDDIAVHTKTATELFADFFKEQNGVDLEEKWAEEINRLLRK